MNGSPSVNLGCLALLFALAGCASTPPTTFLDLTSVPARQTLPAAGGPPVAVGRVQAPPDLDRTALTIQTAPERLEVSGRARWAAPLGAAARLALARDLAARLPRLTVLMPGDSVPATGVRTVEVNLQEFLPDQAGAVTLDADWSITGPRNQVLRRGRFHLTLPGPAGPSAEAQTMSWALGALSDEVAKAF